MPGPVRSVLFLPADNPRAVEKARTLPCDVAILDLEDAVAPEKKAEARRAAFDARASGFGPRLGFRINGLDTPWGEADLRLLRDAGAGLIVAPKVEDAAGARALIERLPEAASLWAMIETPRALMNLNEIAAVGDPVEALMLGVNDLSATLRTGASPDREPLKPWLAATVAAARAHGLRAVDGVFNRFTDTAGFESECAQAALYGFDGKSLIHPSQIAPANTAFSPSEDEVEWARKIFAAFAPAPDGTTQLAVVSADGEMAERLHLDRAFDILARHSVAMDGE